MLTIAFVGALSVGATSAVFTSQATVEDNTFATGTLEVRVNGQSSIDGFDFDNAAPGDCYDGQFTVNNYGAPWFAGPSTLDANTLTVSAVQDGGSTYLFDKLEIDVNANRGWPTAMDVYDGSLSGLTSADLLAPRWSSLVPGNSEDVYYEVCLPADADDSYQGLSTTFDFMVDATT